MVRTHLTWLRDATILMNHRRRDMRVSFEMNIQPDLPTINGRIYSKEICDKMMEDIKKLGYVYLGSAMNSTKHALEMSDYSTPDLKTVAAKVEDVHYHGGKIMIDSIILDTPCGTAVKNTLNEHTTSSLTCIPAGFGSVYKDEENQIKVADDYQIISVHLIPKERQA